MREVILYSLLFSSGLYVIYFIYVLVDKGIKVKEEIFSINTNVEKEKVWTRVKHKFRRR